MTILSTTTITPTPPSSNPITDSPTIKVFPNPATDLLTIRFSSETHLGGEYRVDVIDPYGRTPISQIVEFVDSDIFNLNISPLPTGVYHLQLTAVQSGRTHTCKIFKK